MQSIRICFMIPPVFNLIRNNQVSDKKALVRSKLSLAILAGLTVSAFTAVAEEQGGEQEDYEKIMVRGQKITRTLQETPTSIAVFSAAKLDQQELGSLSETLFEAANVHATPGGINIRGIDGFNVSGAGNSALASVYVDNAAMPRRLIANGFSTWDMNQVEVLRGPQSTLQGRNSLAGAIIMTSEAPSQEFKGKYRVELGQNGQREAAIAFGSGLIEDELAFRFSAEDQSFDGFNYNTTRREDSDFSEDDLYRLKLLYTPKALPELSAQLSYTKATTSRGTNGVNQPEEGVSPFDHRVITNNDPQTLNYKSEITNLDLSYNLSDNWTVTSLTTYSEVDSSWHDYDDDNGPQADGTRYFNEKAKTLSQELRFTFDYENLTGIIGAYYFDQELPSDFGGTTRISLASVGLSPAVLQARFGLDEAIANYVVSQYEPINPAILRQQSGTSEDVTTKAIFADFTYTINDDWDLFAGVRWDRETNENEDSANFILANQDQMPNAANYPTPLNALIGGINAQLLDNVTAASSDRPLVDASFNEIIPKVGVSYRINEDITSSVTVQRGYRSGGVGVNTATGNTYQYEPEFTNNYEWSLRSLFLDGDLMFNANVFYIDWRDQQVNVQLSANTFDTEVRNAGKSEVKGFELESYYQPTPEWEFNASLGLAKTEFKEFNLIIPTSGEDIIRDLSGRRFPDAPELTVNTGVTYTGDNGLYASFNLNYADSSPADVDPYNRGLVEGDANFDLQNEGRTLVNMRVGYEWESMGLYLVGKNIFDKEYIDRAAFGVGRRIVRHDLGAPSQFSLVLRGEF